MGDIKRAKKYIDIHIEMDKEKSNYYSWSWFHYGLIHEDVEEESLKKAVDCIKTKGIYKYCVMRLKQLKANETKNPQYYDKYQQLLIDKFESNTN